MTSIKVTIYGTIMNIDLMQFKDYNYFSKIDPHILEIANLTLEYKRQLTMRESDSS
jgi:hypothetical protein